MLKKLIAIVIITYAFLLQTIAQDARITINGKVSDQNGLALPGVSIVVKGTTIGTASGMDGNFTIDLQVNSTLLFSSIGFQSKEIKIVNAEPLNVMLMEDQESLEEVVVVGYGVQKKSDVTGAIASVKGEELSKTAVANAAQALQGQVSGVSVTSNSGTPGGSVRIRIRGNGTIGNSEPLYVVDGLLLDNIDHLNSQDIASVEILKDASACAIYGSQGANGVILITTKSGKNGKSEISFDANFGVQSIWKKVNLTNANQWAMLRNEAYAAAGLPLEESLINYKTLGEGTDWLDEITRNAQISNYNLSVSGGNDKSTYFIGGGYFTQDGVVEGSEYNRLSFRVNSSADVKKWLKVGENISVQRSNSKTINEDDEWNAVLIQAIGIDPVTSVKNDDGSWGSSDYNDMGNPVAHIDRTHNKDISNSLTGSVYALLKPISGLSIKSSFGLKYASDNSYSYDPAYYVSNDDKNETPTLGRSNSESIETDFTNTITYQKEIDEHHFSVMAGVSLISKRYDWFGTSVTNDENLLPNLRVIDNAVGNIAALSNGNKFEEKMFSYIGRINYSYAGKYLATVNFRRDGSSKFGKKNQFGIFPSFSLGWRLGEEDFIKNIDIISNLKVRAGWGQIGNDKIPAYQFLTTATSGQRYVFNNQIVGGLAFLSAGNDEIKWETTTSTNLGVDLGLWNNKLSLSANYYYKKTTDMLVQPPTPGYVGLQSSPYQNAGDMKNTGIELEISHQNQLNEFEYKISANMSFNKNKVLNLGSNNDAIYDADLRDNGFLSITRVGQPIGQLYGYKTDGLYQNMDEIKSYLNPNSNGEYPVAPGDVKYVDVNGDKVIDGQDKVVIGNPLPKFNFGLNLGASYKGFDFSMFLNGSYGNDIFNAISFYTNSSRVYHNSSEEMLNRWTGEGSTNNARTPRVNANDINNSKLSDRFVEDGSYLRIKNIQLGYTLPKSLLEKISVEKLRFYVSATNLLTLTGYKGFDPEIGEGYDGTLDIGIDRATYPQARTFSFGISASF